MVKHPELLEMAEAYESFAGALRRLAEGIPTSKFIVKTVEISDTLHKLTFKNAPLLEKLLARGLESLH